MGNEPDQRRRPYDTSNADDEAKLEQVSLISQSSYSLGHLGTHRGVSFLPLTVRDAALVAAASGDSPQRSADDGVGRAGLPGRRPRHRLPSHGYDSTRHQLCAQLLNGLFPSFLMLIDRVVSGILGLESLLFLAQTYPRAAQRVCNESLKPNLKWYSSIPRYYFYPQHFVVTKYMVWHAGFLSPSRTSTWLGTWSTGWRANPSSSPRCFCSTDQASTPFIASLVRESPCTYIIKSTFNFA